MEETSERYQKIKQLFNAAIDLDPEERLAFLDDASEGDQSVRLAVEKLLLAREQSEGFIETPAVAFVAQSLLGETAERRIGQYRIIREIGHGGMGTVYLAERDDDEYHKQVAIKVVRRGLDTRDILRRFRNERQILARLDHPNIARLLDGGTTSEGLPYFVMEHIEGLPLIEYCERNDISTTERLRLFRSVCSAVQFAHQNLVIHRDIKPGNILVTSDGTPKLLDFGIAKILEPAENDQATRTEFRAMTPEYASPEQIKGETVTTSSDIYSLGVLLYQLLTGHRPYRLKTTTIDEITRAVCEQEAERPSSIIRKEKENQKLSRRLKGDLDNIVLKALRKEAERRYSSVEQFSEDLRRHLAGLPCIARKDTFAYRSAKFIRRNKVAVSAAALILMTLVAGIVTTFWQARRAERESRAATEERDRARREQAKAERINAFLQQMLAYANPSWYAPGKGKARDLTVLEALDEASRKIESELHDQPEIKAEIHTTIGDTYRAIGRLDRAEPHFESALELRRALFGEDHIKTAESLFYLGGVRSLRGNAGEAERLYRQALDIQRRRDEGNNLPYIMLDLVSLLSSKDEFIEAESLLIEAQEIFRQRYGEDHITAAIVREYLGATYYQWGDIEKAETHLREAMRLYAKTPDSQTGSAIRHLSSIQMTRGNHKEALALISEAYDIYRKTHGEWHPFTASLFLSLAHSRYLQSKTARAKREVEKAIAIYNERMSAGRNEAPSVGMAALLSLTGQHARAEAIISEALKRHIREMPKDGRVVAETKVAMGECLVAQGRFAEAEILFEESLDALRICQLPQSPRIKKVERLLAALYERRGKSR
ncbi:MAG: serine/threonine-protein kinase [Acidobacteriota bacterium]